MKQENQENRKKIKTHTKKNPSDKVSSNTSVHDDQVSSVNYGWQIELESRVAKLSSSGQAIKIPVSTRAIIIMLAVSTEP